MKVALALVVFTTTCSAKLRSQKTLHGPHAKQRQAQERGELDASIERGRALLASDSEADCVPRNVDVEECTGAAVVAKVAELAPGCDVLVGREDDIDQACQDAKLAVDSSTTRNLVEENNLLSNWDSEDLKIFFDGGGEWNEETDNDNGGTNLANQASRAAQIYEQTAQDTRIAVPLVPNFQKDASNYDADPDLAPLNCELPAIMCCWSRDRQANDNNGNCAEPYAENCVDADPADNTDICYADSSRAPESVHVEKGLHWYGTGFEEGEAHCHGLTWSEETWSDSYRFAGNILFFVSFYDHLYQRGYVENIPGAPMCGCVEKMPTVSRSDCTQADVTEVWSLSFKCSSVTSIRRKSLDIEFNACDGATANDLYSEIRQIHDADTIADFETYLVGPSNNDESNCPSTVSDLIN